MSDKFDFEERARIEAMLEDMAENGEEAQRMVAEAFVALQARMAELQAEIERLTSERDAMARVVQAARQLVLLARRAERNPTDINADRAYEAIGTLGAALDECDQQEEQDR